MNERVELLLVISSRVLKHQNGEIAEVRDPDDEIASCGGCVGRNGQLGVIRGILDAPIRRVTWSEKRR